MVLREAVMVPLVREHFSLVDQSVRLHHLMRQKLARVTSQVVLSLHVFHSQRQPSQLPRHGPLLNPQDHQSRPLNHENWPPPTPIRSSQQRFVVRHLTRVLICAVQIHFLAEADFLPDNRTTMSPWVEDRMAQIWYQPIQTQTGFNIELESISSYHQTSYLKIIVIKSIVILSFEKVCDAIFPFERGVDAS